MSAAIEEVREAITQQDRRAVAANLCESVLGAFESVHPNDLRARMLITVARDIGAGMITRPAEIANVQMWARKLVDEAAEALRLTGMDGCASHYAALRVAEAVTLSLAPVVDMAEVERAVEEAREHGEFRRLH